MRVGRIVTTGVVLVLVGGMLVGADLLAKDQVEKLTARQISTVVEEQLGTAPDDVQVTIDGWPFVPQLVSGTIGHGTARVALPVTGLLAVVEEKAGLQDLTWRSDGSTVYIGKKLDVFGMSGTLEVAAQIDVSGTTLGIDPTSFLWNGEEVPAGSGIASFVESASGALGKPLSYDFDELPQGVSFSSVSADSDQVVIDLVGQDLKLSQFTSATPTS